MVSKTFCSSPFVCTRQNAYDRISPCAFGPIEVDVPAGTTQADRWMHPDLTALRNKFLNGDRPGECKRCWDEEDAGIESLRQRTNTAYGTDIADWELGPREIVIKTTNVCNLACRSCGGWDTSLYWTEGEYYTNEYNTTRIDKSGNKVAGNDFVQLRQKVYHNSDLWEPKDLHNVEKLSFFGGEPLLDKQHSKLLQKVIDAGNANVTTLFYSTNGQQIGKHYEELWSQFKRVEIFFSIDGIEKQFEYLRWPGNWEKTKTNIDWFLNLPNRYPNVDWYFQGSQCVSILNIAEYNLTAEWLEDKLGAVHFNIVDHPRHYRMTNIPDYHKAQLLKSIKHEGIKNYLQIEPSDPNELEQMIIWTKRQDLYRNQDYTTTFPETYKLIEPLWHIVSNLTELHNEV
jgi:hypothetical protein